MRGCVSIKKMGGTVQSWQVVVNFGFVCVHNLKYLVTSDDPGPTFQDQPASDRFCYMMEAQQ